MKFTVGLAAAADINECDGAKGEPTRHIVPGDSAKHLHRSKFTFPLCNKTTIAGRTFHILPAALGRRFAADPAILTKVAGPAAPAPRICRETQASGAIF